MPSSSYLKYFLSGERQPGLDPTLVALLGTVRYMFLFIAGVVAQQIADQFARGNYALDFQTLLGYVMPAVVILLGFFWKWVRESNNPFVTRVPGIQEEVPVPVRDVEPEKEKPLM